MSNQQPSCTCGDLATITRLGLEGMHVDPCEIHRPNAQPATPQPEAVALNSDALTTSLAALLGATETTNL